MKSGNLNFLETSGSLQACNGTALPLRISYDEELNFFHPRGTLCEILGSHNLSNVPIFINSDELLNCFYFIY